MRKRPFFFVGLVSFLLALLCSLTNAIIGVVAALVTALCLCAAACLSKGVLSLRTAVLIGLWAVAVAVLFWCRMTYTVGPQLALDGTTASVTMRVEEALSSMNACIVRVENSTLPTGTKLCFWTGYRRIAPKSGDLLRADVELVAAYDKDVENGNYAKANGVFLYAWPTKGSDLVWEDGQGSLPLHKKALYALRDFIHNTLYRRMDFDNAALAEGMMLGRRGNLSDDVCEAFRTSGVYHLLAVSGVHMSIITGAMLSLLGGMSRRTRALVTMGMVVVFMALCGFTASITRAGVMTLVMLGAQLFRRRSDGLNSLGFAAGVMLLVDPFCILDLGWQLSFAATLGLLVFLPVWEREITARGARAMPGIASVFRPLCSTVGVSLCASLTTLPLTALYFGRVSTVFLLGNLVCVPLSSVLLLMLFSAVLTVWLPPFPDMIFAACEKLGGFITAYTERLAVLPFAEVTASGFLIVCLFALPVVLAWIVYVKHPEALR